jgi:hypothetical protein
MRDLASVALAALALAASIATSACDLSRFGQDLPDAATGQSDTPSPVIPGPDATAPDLSALDAAADLVEPAPDAPTPPDAAPTPDDVGPPPECGPGSSSPRPDPCDDYDPCTADTCEAGRCAHAPVPGCCKSDAECDDGIACTLDRCNRAQARCDSVRGDSFCCVTAADCDDRDACTEDVCAAHRCVYPRKATCDASGPALCNDQNDCTSESWSADGTCAYAHRAEGGSACCVDASGCPTADGQVALCQEHRCVLLPTNCEADADCRGTGPCSEGRCVDGRCERPTDCCETQAACDDAVTATTDSCVDNLCVHSLGGAPTACDGATPCVAPSACADVACRVGLCSVTPREGPGCCRVDADCAAPDRCSDAICVDFACVARPTTEARPLWEADFSGLDGWTVTADTTGAAWRLTTAQFTSGPSALFYGKATGGYDVGARPTAGSVLGPPIALPPGVPSERLQVRFWRNLRVEPISSRDVVELDLVRDGQPDRSLWDKEFGTGAGLAWREDTVSLPAGLSGQTVRLRLRFDTIDAVDNAGLGVFIDDLRLLAPCP